MRHLLIFLVSLLIVFNSCKEITNEYSTTAPIDPFADITFMNNGFYTTNLNTSGEWGPQIFLYRLSSDGYVLENKFNLGMNGQGYLAITNDGRNLYLQSRNFNSVIKCSPVGEILYNILFCVDNNWQTCGLTYVPAIDSLCVLVRSIQDLNRYGLLLLSKNNPTIWHKTAEAQINVLDKTQGAYAMDLKGNDLYILGKDTTTNNIIIKTNLFFEFFEYLNLDTDSSTGLCFKMDDLYLSYSSREIKKYTQM